MIPGDASGLRLAGGLHVGNTLVDRSHGHVRILGLPAHHLPRADWTRSSITWVKALKIVTAVRRSRKRCEQPVCRFVGFFFSSGLYVYLLLLLHIISSPCAHSRALPHCFRAPITSRQARDHPCQSLTVEVDTMTQLFPPPPDPFWPFSM